MPGKIDEIVELVKSLELSFKGEIEIREMAYTWCTDYKTWKDDHTRQQYGQYGYEQGYKQAQVDMKENMGSNNYSHAEEILDDYNSGELQENYPMIAELIVLVLESAQRGEI